MSKNIKLFIRKAYEKVYKRRVDILRPKALRIVNDPKVIVALTTFPERFNVVHLAIKSILLQTVRPDKVICYLGCDCTPSMLTAEMKNLMQYGVEYRFVENNIKPHKKYFYAMQEYPDATIITIDDDVLYDRNTIKSLIDCSKKHVGCVCARRIHRIKIDKQKQSFLKYSDWDYEYIPKHDEESMLYFATGIGGVLYPARCLHKDAFCLGTLQEKCLNADDIWLKIMEIRNGTKVAWAKCIYPHPIVLENSQATCLNVENVNKGLNDQYWDELIKDYKISVAQMLDF